jgi:trk system potassium uptake protein TrkH
VIRVIRERTSKKKRIFRHLTLHSKIAITATLALVFVGGLLIFIFEYNNPLTIGELNLFDKIQVSLFQSVTTRTAGFASIPQENLTGAGALASLLLMVVGGSPVGTAGGVKTVTVVILFCSAFSTIRSKNQATLFNRAVSEDSVRKAVAVVASFVIIMFSSAVLLSAVTNADFIDIMYESVSATATVGLSRNFTSSLNLAGKAIIIATMYLGRIGPITLALALGNRGENRNTVSEPMEDISIG